MRRPKYKQYFLRCGSIAKLISRLYYERWKIKTYTKCKRAEKRRWKPFFFSFRTNNLFDRTSFFCVFIFSLTEGVKLTLWPKSAAQFQMKHIECVENGSKITIPISHVRFSMICMFRKKQRKLVVQFIEWFCLDAKNSESSPRDRACTVLRTDNILRLICRWKIYIYYLFLVLKSASRLPHVRKIITGWAFFINLAEFKNKPKEKKKTNRTIIISFEFYFGCLRSPLNMREGSTENRHLKSAQMTNYSKMFEWWCDWSRIQALENWNCRTVGFSSLCNCDEIRFFSLRAIDTACELNGVARHPNKRFCLFSPDPRVIEAKDRHCNIIRSISALACRCIFMRYDNKRNRKYAFKKRQWS